MVVFIFQVVKELSGKFLNINKEQTLLINL